LCWFFAAIIDHNYLCWLTREEMKEKWCRFHGWLSIYSPSMLTRLFASNKSSLGRAADFFYATAFQSRAFATFLLILFLLFLSLAFNSPLDFTLRFKRYLSLSPLSSKQVYCTLIFVR
jgi:hypothetical protein